MPKPGLNGKRENACSFTDLGMTIFKFPAELPNFGDKAERVG